MVHPNTNLLIDRTLLKQSHSEVGELKFMRGRIFCKPTASLHLSIP